MNGCTIKQLMFLNAIATANKEIESHKEMIVKKQ